MGGARGYSSIENVCIQVLHGSINNSCGVYYGALGVLWRVDVLWCVDIHSSIYVDTHHGGQIVSVVYSVVLITSA